VKNPFKRKKESTPKAKPVQLVPGKGTLAQRLRAREQAVKEMPDRPDPPHSQTKAVITSTTYGRSKANADSPDSGRANVSKSYTAHGSRGLKTPMMHRSPKTLRGKSVVTDKPDHST
jgi:hypothetical protein